MTWQKRFKVLRMPKWMGSLAEIHRTCRPKVYAYDWSVHSPLPLLFPYSTFLRWPSQQIWALISQFTCRFLDRRVKLCSKTSSSSEEKEQGMVLVVEVNTIWVTLTEATASYILLNVLFSLCNQTSSALGEGLPITLLFHTTPYPHFSDLSSTLSPCLFLRVPHVYLPWFPKSNVECLAWEIKQYTNFQALLNFPP